MEIAFRYNNPAIISGHRVNFSGHIEPSIREFGIGELNKLLNRIVKRWPEVEFMSSVQLGELINNKT